MSKFTETIVGIANACNFCNKPNSTELFLKVILLFNIIRLFENLDVAVCGNRFSLALSSFRLSLFIVTLNSSCRCANMFVNICRYILLVCVWAQSEKLQFYSTQSSLYLPFRMFVSFFMWFCKDLCFIHWSVSKQIDVINLFSFDLFLCLFCDSQIVLFV